MIWGQISPAHGDRGAKPPEGGRRPLILVVVCCGCVLCCDLWTLVREQRRDDLGENLPSPWRQRGKAARGWAAATHFGCCVLWLCFVWVDFFVRESKRFMVEQNLILFYPWCYYATQKYHDMRRGICRTYVRYGTKMYGIRNYYGPPLDEASKIIWKILLR